MCTHTANLNFSIKTILLESVINITKKPAGLKHFASSWHLWNALPLVSSGHEKLLEKNFRKTMLFDSALLKPNSLRNTSELGVD